MMTPNSSPAQFFSAASSRIPPRPAWAEIDLDKLRRNFEIIHADKPKSLRILSVVKDEAYGHGAEQVAKIALESGSDYLAVVTLEEGVALREKGIPAPILCLGERHPYEFPFCLDYNLACCLSDLDTAKALSSIAAQRNATITVHVKIDTGMSRYGVRWEKAVPLLEKIKHLPGLSLEGILSHFAMSDELDKSYAHLQLARFQEVLERLKAKGIQVPCRHFCNSGGFLDLPQAHFDMVRIGILPLGIYPSQVCRRIPGIEPVLAVKSRIACIQKINKGDCVGYGMRYVAPDQRRIAVVPIGYGDGFPRVRNQGYFLVRGKRASLVGSVSMDAVTIDITDIPEAELWDEVVILGRQGTEEISVHDIARIKNSVSYDILVSWNARLPRIYLENGAPR